MIGGFQCAKSRHTPDLRKNRPDARTAAAKRIHTRKHGRMVHGNPRSVKSQLEQGVQFMVRDGVETAGKLSLIFRVLAGAVVK